MEIDGYAVSHYPLRATHNPDLPDEELAVLSTRILWISTKTDGEMVVRMRKVLDIKRRADKESDRGILIVEAAFFLLVGNCIIHLEDLGIFQTVNSVEGLYGS